MSIFKDIILHCLLVCRWSLTFPTSAEHLASTLECRSCRSWNLSNWRSTSSSTPLSAVPWRGRQGADSVPSRALAEDPRPRVLACRGRHRRPITHSPTRTGDRRRLTGQPLECRVLFRTKFATCCWTCKIHLTCVT